MAALSPQTMALAGRRAAPLLDLFPEALALAGRRGVPVTELSAGVLDVRRASPLLLDLFTQAEALAGRFGGVLAPSSTLFTRLQPPGKSVLNSSGCLAASTHLGTEGSGSACLGLLTPSGFFPPSSQLATGAFHGGSAAVKTVFQNATTALPASLGTPVWEFISPSLQCLVPSAFAAGTSSGRLTVGCIVTVGAVVFFSSDPSKQPPAEDPFGLGEPTPPGEDPEKTMLKLLKKIAAKFSKFPVPEEKSVAWYTQILEYCFGQKAAGHLLMVTRILHQRWKELKLIILTVTGCWSLKIDVFQAVQIVQIIIEEQSDEFQSKLERYARKAEKKTDGEDDEAEKVVAYSVYDITTQEAVQFIILSKGIDEAALRKLIEDLAKRQPPPPKAKLHPGLRALLKAYEEPALRRLVKEDQKPNYQYNAIRSNQNACHPEYRNKAIPTYQNKPYPGLTYGVKSPKSADQKSCSASSDQLPAAITDQESSPDQVSSPADSSPDQESLSADSLPGAGAPGSSDDE